MKKIWIEYNRAFATIAVIFLHIASSLIDNGTVLEIGITKFIFLDICQLLQRWAVPCFFMITGALLLNPDKKVDIKKYIFRISIVLILFATFYSFLELLFEYKTINLKIIAMSILNALQNKSWGHLWYLYTLIGLYLITPVLRIVIKNMEDISKFIIVLIVGCLGVNTVNYLFNVELENFMLFNEYILYYITGFYLSLDKNKFTNKNFNIICIFLIFVVMIILDIINIFVNGANLTWICGLDNILVYLLSTSVFLLIKNIYKNKKSESKYISYICKYSFLIYLVHPFFINVFYKVLHITPLVFLLPVGIIIIFFAVSLLSLLSAIIIKKMPIIKKYV